MNTPTQHQPLADSVRQAARRFVTGVTIVAIRDADGSHALTANSFVTLSLHPALVGISVRPDGRMRSLVAPGRQFGISVLNERQAEYARHFARKGRFDGTPHLNPLTADGPPLVPACVAYFVCGFERIHPVGDHDLIIGSVLRCGVGDTRLGPLVFLDGEFHGHRQ